MIGGVTVPTSIRRLNQNEQAIVDRVFLSTNLPYPFRVWITNGAGLNGAPFTIPTSLITEIFGTVAATIMGTVGGAYFTKSAKGAAAGGLAAGALAAAGGYLTSAVNLAYVMNVGPSRYADMSADPILRACLVHEMTHVWQGRNSTFALTYVASSVVAQCSGMASGGGVAGRSAAYGYTPGKAWSQYNAEQQAKIVEHWFDGGESTSGPVYADYIEARIRKGLA